MITIDFINEAFLGLLSYFLMAGIIIYKDSNYVTKDKNVFYTRR